MQQYSYGSLTAENVICFTFAVSEAAGVCIYCVTNSDQFNKDSLYYYYCSTDHSL